MPMAIKRTAPACLLAAALCIMPIAAGAQDYPTKPIVMVVPFPPGGPSDVVARIIAEGMGRAMKSQIVIENVGGAGGTVGSMRVASAAPDGYTLLAGSMGSHVAAPVLQPNVTYDSQRDFVPVGVTAHAPAVIVARKNFPADDIKELVEYVKANATNVRQGHGGIGASSHMACEMFNIAAGVTPLSVAYRGTGPAMNDLLGGHIDFLCEQAVSVTSQIASGAVRAYAVSANERLPTLADVPTAKEAGIDYQMSIWSGIFAPKGTPAPIVDQLAKALDAALDDDAVRKRIIDLGGAIPAKEERTPASFAAYVKNEIDRWEPILKAAKAASEKAAN